MNSLPNQKLNPNEKLGKRILSYSISDFVIKGLYFLIIPIFTASMSPNEYGIIGVMASLTTFMVPIFTLQLPVALTINYYKIDDSQKKLLLSTIFFFSSITATILLGIFLKFGFDLSIKLFNNIPYFSHVLLAGLTGYFLALLEISKTYFRISKQTNKFVWLNFIYFIVFIGLSLILIFLFDFDSQGVIIGGLVASIFSFFVSIVFIRKNISLKVSGTLYKTALILSLPLLLHVISHWGLNFMDRILLVKYLTLADAGVYQLGYQVGTGLQVLVLATNNAWLPYFHQQLGNKTKTKEIQNFSTNLFILQVLAGFIIALFAKEIIVLISPKSYHQASLIVPWIVLGYIFVAIYHNSINILFFEKKTKLIPIATMVSALVNLMLNIIYLPRYGVIAAAIITSVSYAVLAISTYFIAKRIRVFPYEYLIWIKCIVVSFFLYQFNLTVYSGNLIIGILIKLLIIVVWFILIGKIKHLNYKEFKNEISSLFLGNKTN